MRPLTSYYGSKYDVNREVWARFGTCGTFVEGFAGSLAILLGMPSFDPTGESQTRQHANDAYPFLINLYRAVQRYGADFLGYFDYVPTKESFIGQVKELSAAAVRLRQDLQTPESCDIELAGKYLNYMCYGYKPKALSKHPKTASMARTPKGILAKSRRDTAEDQLREASARLQRAELQCQPYKAFLATTRLASPTVNAVFLDPPYEGYQHLYTVTNRLQRHDYAGLNQWCIDYGEKPNFRVAICGYPTDYSFPGTWDVFEWYNSQKHLEYIWFSPHCLERTTGLRREIHRVLYSLHPALAPTDLEIDNFLDDRFQEAQRVAGIFERMFGLDEIEPE